MPPSARASQAHLGEPASKCGNLADPTAQMGPELPSQEFLTRREKHHKEGGTGANALCGTSVLLTCGTAHRVVRVIFNAFDKLTSRVNLAVDSLFPVTRRSHRGIGQL